MKKNTTRSNHVSSSTPATVYPVKWLALTLAARKQGRKGLTEGQCPWLKIKGEAGSLEYAKNVYDWMEHEFGLGHFCIVDDQDWWFVEERNPDAARLDWVLNWIGHNDDVSRMPESINPGSEDSA